MTLDNVVERLDNLILLVENLFNKLNILENIDILMYIVIMIIILFTLTRRNKIY